jgi:hypothetical protein
MLQWGFRGDVDPQASNGLASKGAQAIRDEVAVEVARGPVIRRMVVVKTVENSPMLAVAMSSMPGGWSTG